MIRTSNPPTRPCQRPTRRDVARRLAAFFSFTLLAVLFAFPGVAMADPPDSAFVVDDPVVKTVNIMADKRYHNPKDLPAHKEGVPWIDASTAKVVHKVDPKTNVPNPTMADVIWKGKSKEGIPYFFKAWVRLNSDGSFSSMGTDVILFGEKAEKAGDKP